MGLPTGDQAPMFGGGPLRAGVKDAFRSIERSTVLAPSRTRRAGLRRCRCAASWTAPARGALPRGGRDEGISVPVELRDGFGLWRCRRAVVGVEQHLPLQQNAGNPEQPVGDTAQGPAVGVTARPKGGIAAAA